MSNATRNTMPIGLNQLAVASIMPPMMEKFLTSERYMPSMMKNINGSSLSTEVPSP